MATLTTPSVGATETEQSHPGLSEPSMEDILASIRRIIAEDQSNTLGRSGLGSAARRASSSVVAPQPPAALGTPAEDPAIEVVAPTSETEPMRHDDEEARSETLRGSYEAEAQLHHEPTIALPDQSEPAAPQEPIRDHFVAAELSEATPARDGHDEDTPLISSTAGASITSSFHALAESVLMQDPDMIERVTRDELRPLLKTWLDDNLPSIVERLVRIEIERVARGGRSRD